MMLDKIRNIDRNVIVLVVGILLLSIGFAFTRSDSPVTDTDEVATAQETTEENNQQEPAEEAPEESGSYNYVAQPGDSYTKMARKAVQTYGIVNGVDLSPAQIVYAETSLTRDAGSPELNVGQEVTFDGAMVQDVVKQAGELSEEAQALWAPYVAYVDFNTDAVGEARE